MFKRIFTLTALLISLALPFAARAQTLTMRSAHLSFDFPESWLVVSPQMALIYAPLLTDAGIDAQALSQELSALNVHARAYNADYSEWLSVMTMDGELAEEIYEIERVTDEQRKAIKNAFDADALWETTGLRAQDSEWQREGGVYWLYVHYTRTLGGQTIGRGVRYVSVHNGQYVMLDWQTDGRRFTNADLRAFRGMLGSLAVTERIAEPMRAVKLNADIPTETNEAAFTIDGTATPGATLLAAAPDASGAMQVLSVGEVGGGGSFSLLVELEDEGQYDVTLTASKEGMLDSSVRGTLTYSAHTLPVSLSGLPEDGVITSDKVTVSGETLAGVQMQLVTPYGLTRKRSGNSGAFSFDLTTQEEGDYRYTLICDKEGYDQRRIEFTLTRVMTEEQNKDATREGAVGISYRELQRDLDKNRGQTVRIYGPVVEVSASGNTQYVRMHYNRDSKGQWYNPVIVTASEEMNVKPGDMVTLVATVAGVFEEQDTEGNPVMVPWLDLLFVDAVE